MAGWTHCADEVVSEQLEHLLQQALEHHLLAALVDGAIEILSLFAEEERAQVEALSSRGEALSYNLTSRISPPGGCVARQ